MNFMGEGAQLPAALECLYKQLATSGKQEHEAGDGECLRELKRFVDLSVLLHDKPH
jgi:hypothetical protein